jgi:localization factor PodJL
MNSGASWNERGLSPELYQAAREAASRAGMSVEEWLRSTFGDSAVTAGGRPQTGPLGTRLGELSQRFARAGDEPATSVRGARLADTVAKLNARLEQMTAGQTPDAGHAAPSAPPISPELPDLGIDQAIAEIAARQRALENSPAAAEPPQPANSNPDFASLERQLHHITEQIETLRRPSGVEDAIAGLRNDLADVARAVHEALPRRSLESLQSDVHALAERIDRGYGRGADPSALEAIERSLAEVHERLNAMTPAENLAGFEERVAELSHKMDSLAVGSPDPETLRYLEAAINELRELSAGVASAEGVASLAGDVQALGARIDHIAESTGSAGLDSLAARVNDLTQALDSRIVEMGPLPQHIESLVQFLSDKLNRSSASTHEQAAFEQIERQIAGIVDRIEVVGQKSGDLGAIERGIQQLTLQVREAREESAATAERVARRVAADLAQSAPAGADVASLKHDLASLHINHVESEQRTHETLEAVHDTLERLVERLAMIETGAHSAPQPAYTPPTPPSYAPPAQPVHAAPPVQPREPMAMPEMRLPEPEPAPVAAEPAHESSLPALRQTPFMHVQRSERPPIDPDLPADTPLEPGSAGRGRTAAERIAASEAALAPLKRDPAPEITGKANFIAAARRAAQAAANEGVPVEAPRVEEKDEATPTSLIGRFLANRRRALMVGVSALLVLYGTIQVIGMMGNSDSAPEAPPPASSQAPAEPKKIAAPVVAPAPPPPAPASEAAAPEPAPPPVSAPSRQSAAEPLVAPTPTTSLIAPTPVPSPIAPSRPAPAATPADITGSVKQPMNIASLATQAPAAAAPATAAPQLTGTDKLPPGIGGPALRSAAASGNPAAEYEIGVRYAEGRGVPANPELAVHWLDRAARQGLAPALYRLGSLYEKGQGVKKDLDKARQLYLVGADKGNAKAIHNLAVLYAEGIDGKPDYRTASQWFRKAADRGIADSQYNLGILYARGIGVDQNLAESYKWFALAAQQGDQDAAKKREDVASRLDQQSLVAAKLAAQTWVADPPPDEAMNVKAPPGGWDQATSAAPAPAKPTATVRRKPHAI